MQYTIDELYTKKEGQTYDRKSARKDPKSLSNHIVAFANADGGMLVIGIEDDFTVTGKESMTSFVFRMIIASRPLQS